MHRTYAYRPHRTEDESDQAREHAAGKSAREREDRGYARGEHEDCGEGIQVAAGCTASLACMRTATVRVSSNMLQGDTG